MRTFRFWLLTLCCLFVFCFGLAAGLDTWFQSWQGNRANSANLLSVLLGDGRRIFARHFFVKADAYFHSGYYPTIFDNRRSFQTPHMAEDAGAVGGNNEGDENTFLGKPRDWIDALSRRLYPSVHTHLDEGGARGRQASEGDLGSSSEVREILPWLRLSASLDPENIETYTVTAYWLRQRMGRVDEAEQFLREGLKANPESYEILYELGRVYQQNRDDRVRARNLWEAALLKWTKSESGKTNPDKFHLREIVSHLAMLEKAERHYEKALALMTIWKSTSPEPEEVQKRIDETRQEMAASTASHSSEAESHP